MTKEKIYISMKNNNINLDQDVFDYGFNILITYLKYLAVIIPFSILLSIVYEVFIFIIFFIPIRRFVGGFHFDNLNYCFIGSVVSVIALTFLGIHLHIYPVIAILIIILTFFCTVSIGTLEHPNKKLTLNEKQKYKKNALFVETIYVIIWITSKLIGYTYLSNIIILIFLFCIGGLCILKFFKQ